MEDHPSEPKQDASVPLVLTFCRPQRAERQGKPGHQVYGVIGDAHTESQVTSWPVWSLPFPLYARRSLSVRIVLAANEADFQRGNVTEVGTCCIPIWKMAELAATSDKGSWELVLALSPSASNMPGGEEVSQSPLAMFEASRQLALADPNVARLSVMVQSPQFPGPVAIFSSPAADAASRSPLASARTPTAALADAARERRETLSRPRGPSSPGPLAAMARGVPMESRRSKSNSPDSRNKAHGSDVYWHEKFVELSQICDQNETTFEARLKEANHTLGFKEQTLESVGDLVGARMQRWALEEVFDAWHFIAQEDSSARKKEALTETCTAALQQRRLERSNLAIAVANLEAEVAKQTELERQQQIQRTRLFGAMGELWLYESGFSAVLRRLLAWRSIAKRKACARRILLEKAALVTMGILSAMMLVWHMEVGEQRCERVRQSAKERAAEVPGQLRAAVSKQGARLLELYTAVRSGDARTQPLRIVIEVWAAAAQANTEWRRQAEELLTRSRLRCSAEDTLMAAILCKWRGAVDKASASRMSESARYQGNTHSAVERLRKWMHLSSESTIAMTMYAALVCWRSGVAHQRLQNTLETSFSQGHDREAKTALRQQELQRVQEALASEEGRWAAESERLVQKHAALEKEVADSNFMLEEANEDFRMVEQQHSSAKEKLLQLVSELATAQEHLTTSTQQLQALVETSAGEAEQCHEQVALYEEEAAEARVALQKLESEASRHQARKQREARDVRQQFRGQISRAKEAARRLQTAKEEDQATWGDRLQVSAQRRQRLEQEIQRLRKSAQEVLPRCSELEAENSKLQDECNDMDARLRHLEVVERGRREELASLRAAKADLQRRCEALASAPVTARSQLPASSRSSLTASGPIANF
mmetsp:Transcript_25701/g.59926  ORF Transcript_25701/g.59926 Transcript_25701/m.59926 type:complete len:888 (+) Transcript_25701:90-2753(+)